MLATQTTLPKHWLNVDNFFPTPKPVIEKLLAGLEIRRGDIILEPSAGKGNIADALSLRYPRNELRVIELDPHLRHILTLKGHTVVGSDLFAYHEPVDVVVQNPPFRNNFQDIDHFNKAWELLRKGGRIASVLHLYSAFPRLGYGKPYRFATWLEQIGARKVRLTNAFINSERPTSTEIALVWAEKR